MDDVTVEVLDAFDTGHVTEAAELVFEYMAATCAEVGWPVPTAASGFQNPSAARSMTWWEPMPHPAPFSSAFARGVRSAESA